MKKKLIWLGLLALMFFTGGMITSYASFQDVYYPGCNTEPFYVVGKQWGLDKIQIEKAWEKTVGKREIKVGVIDTGIDITHGDLNNCVDRELSKSFLDKNESFEGRDAYGNPIPRYDDPFYDISGHGTHVAGIIAADSNNSYGMVGVAPNITLVSLRVTNINEKNDLKDVEEAILYAEEIGIDILNYSAGGQYSKDVEDAIKNFSGLFVCAAGNSYQNNDKLGHYPSNLKLSNLIAVGASDENDQIWKSKETSGGSNYGLKNVDLFAPGDNIISTYPIMICDGTYRTKYLDSYHDDYHLEDGFHYSTGTSMAAPFVTAVAALLLSSDYSYTPEALKTIILDSVDRVDGLKNYCVSGGRLNAEKALKNSTHMHKFKVSYLNSERHIKNCSCGLTSGSAELHYVTKEIYDRNPSSVICLGCLKKLDLSKDFVSIIRSKLKTKKITENGSYTLPNGILILVEEDIEAYKEGTLIFY